MKCREKFIKKISGLLFSTLLTVVTISACGQQEFDTRNGDAVIHYKIYGTGKPLLLINGGPGYSSSHFHDIATELGKNFKVIIYDQRGTGKSKVNSYDSSTINLRAFTNDMEAIRKAMKLNSWMVAGQSFGGLLAMAYATDFQDRVDKLLLVSSAGLNLNFLNSFQDNIKRIIGSDTSKYKMPDTATYDDWFLNMVNVNAPAYVYDKSKSDLIRSVLVNRKEFVGDVNALMWQDLFKINFNLTNKLKIFKKKTLIIQGAQDIVGMDTAYETHSVITSSQLVFIRKCGHVPWLDRPTEFYSSVTAFLNN